MDINIDGFVTEAITEHYGIAQYVNEPDRFWFVFKLSEPEHFVTGFMNREDAVDVCRYLDKKGE